jgi:hypothetical protein
VRSSLPKISRWGGQKREKDREEKRSISSAPKLNQMKAKKIKINKK